ncbi:MAG: PilN domain-containing protein [Xanthomonadales bacterium]|nr:PilN domain-containing protein [Gammaproteobacteria bacterium]MBT8051463.1 PilN domain-containing protein [Gammaproteobacteria bacterium]MBT8055960.1 PilN domain-containing protein [Gammaproteobacteria bacterium]NNJ77856.1 PilN domain-containing protein [Xanthomonadales bacterium]NNL04775.1 PilN domain-containing protein [Xanthomonadales bacterium]
MANALQQKLQDLRSRVGTGPVGKFLSWWWEELRLAMPESWQQKLQHATRRVAVSEDAGQLEIGVDENRRLQSLASLPLSQDAALQRQQVEDLRIENDLTEAPVFLLLDADKVLARDVTLPAAAEQNLAQVLTFEMDRQTPFKASAVYFDWEVLERGGSGGQLRLKLFVVPRGEVDAAQKTLAGRGLLAAGVDIREDTRTLGLNLLPAEKRHRVVNSKSRLNWALGGAAAVLLVLVMALSLGLRGHQVNELEEAIAEVRGEAMEVDRIRTQIEGASEAAGFLALRRSESPLAVELLADITRFLPDDTYLDRLVIGRTSVQMQGKSTNAQQLIELVNESPYLSAAAFRGSTRLDARSGLEIFEINAQIATGGGDGSGS